MMSGFPLTTSYQLLQLHFHWGSKNGRGSEHTINGKRFPMEMHLVHQASNIESATSPVNVPEGLAVAAFMWKVGPAFLLLNTDCKYCSSARMTTLRLILLLRS